MEIPFSDSTTLSYLAEFHEEIDGQEKAEIIQDLSDTGKLVGRAILGELPPDAPESLEAYEAARVLKSWAEKAAASR